MTTAGQIPLPLRDVFERLREKGFPLGVADFVAAQRALELGEGIGGREELVRLCQLLWAKSQGEATEVARIFDEVLRERVSLQPPRPAPREPQEAGAEAPPSERDTARNEAPHSLPSEATPPANPGQKGVGLKQRANIVPVESPPTAFRRAAIPHEFFPIVDRQMKQSWRRLRRFVRHGPPTEPDVDATIARAGREGVLADLVLVARRVNDAALVLFVDQHGSMVPFHGYARQLVETASRGGRLATLDVYYFHDCPTDVVFRDPGLLDAVALDDVLASAARHRAGALVFSDAGAARRTFSRERVDESRQFLSRIQSRIRHVGWLNPVPRARWRATSASRVREMVPMFELTVEDVAAALRLLRGRRPWRRARP